MDIVAQKQTNTVQQMKLFCITIGALAVSGETLRENFLELVLYRNTFANSVLHIGKRNVS